MICTLHQILFVDQVEKNEMRGICSIYGVQRCIQEFGDEVRGKETIWKI